MPKDTRKFLITVNGHAVYEVIDADDFDHVIKDLLDKDFTLDQIKVWVEGNFRLIPERYEVD